MTDKQEAFIKKLADERHMDPDAKNRLLQLVDSGTMPTWQASQTIDWLMRQPLRTTPVAAFSSTPQSYSPSRYQPLPEVPEGRFAVEHEGTLKFFIVDKPTEGKWAGRTFVKVQASDLEYPIKNPDKRLEILNLIAVDPQGAMLRYGKELGHCGHCGRTLTNEESRERGIGPICAAGLGW